jgi:hypothetical protein
MMGGPNPGVRGRADLTRETFQGLFYCSWPLFPDLENSAIQFYYLVRASLVPCFHRHPHGLACFIILGLPFFQKQRVYC